MAKDKERSVNPAQQQRKLEKAKALKKSKAELQTRRNEKLARRNPERIQRQIDDLKALETGGDIKPREKAILADLERDIKAVHKARDALGDKAPQHSTRPQHNRDRQDAPQSSLGKRRHDGQRKFDNHRHDSGSDTDESVRNIPWPKDTPPPVPREFRRDRNANTTQIGERTHQAVAPLVETKTTYESAPQIRDLKKEATARFVPSVVKRKQDAAKGAAGQLLEPEELDSLEREGYVRAGQQRSTETLEPKEASYGKFSEYNPKGRDDLLKLKAEEEAFQKELAMHGADDDPGSAGAGEDQPSKETRVADATRLLSSRQVEIEEVEDEDL